MADSITPQAPTKPRKPLWRRILKWTLRIAIVLLVLLVVIWSVWNFSASRSLRDEIAKIRGAGEPLTFADLTASLSKVDEADDSGPYYTAALALHRRASYDKLNQFTKTLDTLIDERTPPTTEFIATVQRLLEDERLALEMLDLASSMPRCAYEIGLEYGISFFTSRVQSAWSLTRLRSLARLVSMRTRFLALQGQSDQAIQSAISSLRMLRIFDRQPILICHLVRIACLSMTVDDISVILEFGQPSDQALADLENTLRQAEQSLDLKRVLFAERVYSMELMRNIISPMRNLEIETTQQPPMFGQWPSNIVSRPIMRTFASRLLRVQSQLIDVADKDFPELLEAIKAVEKQDFSIWDCFGKMLIPAMERTTVQQARALAMIRSARLAIMIELYRREHSKLPQSLADLQTPNSQRLPLDPFTGQNLIYRSTDSGYMIYSLGQDRQDNGGPTSEPNPYGQPADHGLRIRVFKP